MNALTKLARMLGKIWAPALMLLIVLACGLYVQVNALQTDPHPALSVALLFGPVI